MFYILDWKFVRGSKLGISSSTTTQQMAWLVRGRGAWRRRRDRRSGEEQPRRLLERAERGVRRLHHSRGAQECGGEARRHLLTGDSGTIILVVHMLSACFSAVHMHISMGGLSQVWCTCGARSCSPATVRCGTAAYVQSAAVECALYGRVSRCRSASLCMCTACMCSVRALHTPAG